MAENDGNVLSSRANGFYKMTSAQRDGGMDLLYMTVYDAAHDESYLKLITGDVPNGVTPLTADEAKASGLPIR